MSSPDLERGLLATCVASRCSVLNNAEDRSLVWWLQRQSHQPGGLERMVTEMVALWPERFRSAFMQTRHGKRPYRHEEIAAFVRDVSGYADAPPDDDGKSWLAEFIAMETAAKGIVSILSPGHADEIARGAHDRKSIENLLNELTESAIPAEAVEGMCRSAALGKFFGVEGLADFLFKRVCLDPGLKPCDWRTWYLPALRQTLTDYRARCLSACTANFATTDISRRVFEALDYGLEIRGLVLIQGLERRGKTVSAKVWCDLHPGETRYIKTPSTGDDGGFFREIARALGIGCGQSIKTVELRERIEDVVRGGDLMLVFDNAHFCFRQAMYREAIPQRLMWILTALVDEGIPIALVSTPQFTVAQQLTAEKSKWREAQLTGRIDHFEQLPELLSAVDLEAVAKVCLPEADDQSIELLVTYAQASDKYLQAIGSLVQRASFLANKSGRAVPTYKDLKIALESSVIPSDNAIVAATEAAKAHVHGRPLSRGS